ncbi:MAG TPA: 50S ribosomal protein L29 [Flavobacteriales bacterium]|nr:50S ribosomal protein L29 [Flavobacteriales bacterium]HCA82750.1 50S ribosomal protein L29 [Flavobacteriales bacterium]
MKAKDIKDLTLDELREKLGEMSADYSKTKINHAISPVENPMLIRSNRRMIARIQTEIRNKEAKAVNK